MTTTEVTEAIEDAARQVAALLPGSPHELITRARETHHRDDDVRQAIALLEAQGRARYCDGVWRRVRR